MQRFSRSEASFEIRFPVFGIGRNDFRGNKMELLQSQAPVDQELSGSSASARHGTSDIGH